MKVVVYFEFSKAIKTMEQVLPVPALTLKTVVLVASSVLTTVEVVEVDLRHKSIASTLIESKAARVTKSNYLVIPVVFLKEVINNF